MTTTRPTVYLDYAAATPVADEVLATMRPFNQNAFQNPSALYLSALEVAAAIDRARESVAKIVGVKPGEVVFTSGATESNNLAILGVLRQFAKPHIIVSAIEHSAVLEPAKNSGADVTELPVDGSGRVDPKDLEQAITPQTVLVSIGYANNEVGTVQDLCKIAKVINRAQSERRRSKNARPLFFHTDATQAAQFLDLNVHRLGVDLMTLSGGKIYGPKQSGCLYVASRVKLTPLMFGGGQERGLRGGTLSPAQIAGFAAALKLVHDRRHDEAKRVGALRDRLEAGLISQFPQIRIMGSPKHRLPNMSSLLLPIADGERFVMELDEAGIQAGTGSACSARSDEPSHVLLATGLRPAEANTNVRFSLGRQTTDKDITFAVDRTAKLLSAPDS